MTRLAFAPVIPFELLAVLAAVAVLITLYAFYMRAHGAWARGLAFAVLLFALSGPLLVKEKHSPLPDVAVIVTDRSQSMSLGKRVQQAETARAAIKRMLAQQP
jgi:inner membrane protein involved in colicin E2 resistance